MRAGDGRERGATLVELSVGLLLLGVLAAALAALWVLIAGQGRRVTEQALAQAHVQTAAHSLSAWVHAAKVVSAAEAGCDTSHCRGTHGDGSGLIESLSLELLAQTGTPKPHETLQVYYADPATGAPATATRCRTAAGATLYPIVLVLLGPGGGTRATQSGLAWQPQAAREPLFVHAGERGHQGTVAVRIAGFAGPCGRAHLAPLTTRLRPQAGRSVGAGL